MAGRTSALLHHPNNGPSNTCGQVTIKLPCLYARYGDHKHRTKGSPMAANPVLWEIDQRGVATLTLNRPEVNNAYDAGLIDGVLSARPAPTSNGSTRCGRDRP